MHAWRSLQSKKKNKKQEHNRQKDRPSKRRHVKGRQAPDKPSKDNSKGYRYTKRNNKIPKTPFPRKSRDNLKEILGTAYYNCKKKDHITRGYY